MPTSRGPPRFASGVCRVQHRPRTLPNRECRQRTVEMHVGWIAMHQDVVGPALANHEKIDAPARRSSAAVEVSRSPAQLRRTHGPIVSSAEPVPQSYMDPTAPPAQAGRPFSPSRAKSAAGSTAATITARSLSADRFAHLRPCAYKSVSANIRPALPAG